MAVPGEAARVEPYAMNGRRQASRRVSTRHTESVRHKSKRPRIWRARDQSCDREAKGRPPRSSLRDCSWPRPTTRVKPYFGVLWWSRGRWTADTKRRDESRRGRQECLRHNGMQRFLVRARQALRLSCVSVGNLTARWRWATDDSGHWASKAPRRHCRPPARRREQ